jgi:hypothetical protein
MKKVVTISKSSSVKTENVKNFNIDDLYKKCKFRKKDDFGLRHTWNYKNNYYSIFSKDKGRANSENKYDLPPPLDNELYFGSMIIIKHTGKIPKNNQVVDLEDKEWLKLYEHLFGGFEDLGDEDSVSEEEDIPDELKTKHGYLKDGFVVSSDAEDDDDEYVPNDDDEEEEEEDLSETDDEADYGGETDDEMPDLVDDDDEDDEFVDDDDEDPASELSEEEYSY